MREPIWFAFNASRIQQSQRLQLFALGEKGMRNGKFGLSWGTERQTSFRRLSQYRPGAPGWVSVVGSKKSQEEFKLGSATLTHSLPGTVLTELCEHRTNR